MSDAEAEDRFADAPGDAEAPVEFDDDESDDLDTDLSTEVAFDVDAVLADFRTWLEELTEVPEVCDEPESIDLHEVVSQFTALRHEINLQTKAARSALEQNGTAVDRLGEALTALRSKPSDDSVVKPLLKAVVDVYDNLAIAVRQAERQRAAIDAPLDELTSATEIPAPPDIPATLVPSVAERPRGFWARLFGGGSPPVNSEFATAIGQQMMADWRDEVIKDADARRGRIDEAAQLVRSSLDGLIAGYRMSLNRIDRAISQFELEPIPALGERFDPELMEVIEVAGETGRPAGEVVEELRRGYRWRGSVFRFAQVKVAR